jgi:hypothetical protein
MIGPGPYTRQSGDIVGNSSRGVNLVYVTSYYVVSLIIGRRFAAPS